MERQLGYMRREIRAVVLFDRLRGAQVRALFARQRELVVQGLAHEGVGEAVDRRSPPHRLRHQLATGGFLDGLEQGLVVETRHRLQDVEAKVPAEDGCIGERLVADIRQTRESPADRVPHAFRDPQLFYGLRLRNPPAAFPVHRTGFKQVLTHGE